MSERYAEGVAESVDEASGRAEFTLEMLTDVTNQSRMPTRGTAGPWEVLAYYVGALERRVKELERGF